MKLSNVLKAATFPLALGLTMPTTTVAETTAERAKQAIAECRGTFRECSLRVMRICHEESPVSVECVTTMVNTDVLFRDRLVAELNQVLPDNIRYLSTSNREANDAEVAYILKHLHQLDFVQDWTRRVSEELPAGQTMVFSAYGLEDAERINQMTGSDKCGRRPLVQAAAFNTNDARMFLPTDSPYQNDQPVPGIFYGSVSTIGPGQALKSISNELHERLSALVLDGLESAPFYQITTWDIDNYFRTFFDRVRLGNPEVSLKRSRQVLLQNPKLLWQDFARMTNDIPEPVDQHYDCRAKEPDVEVSDEQLKTINDLLRLKIGGILGIEPKAVMLEFDLYQTDEGRWRLKASVKS